MRLSSTLRIHNDMKRFALYGRPTIEKAPLPTCRSTLIFAPAKSMVRKQFGDRIHRWMQRLSDIREDWSALLQTLEGHTKSVNSAAFSTDGALWRRLRGLDVQAVGYGHGSDAKDDEARLHCPHPVLRFGRALPKMAWKVTTRLGSRRRPYLGCKPF